MGGLRPLSCKSHCASQTEFAFQVFVRVVDDPHGVVRTAGVGVVLQGQAAEPSTDGAGQVALRRSRLCRAFPRASAYRRTTSQRTSVSNHCWRINSALSSHSR